MLLKPAGSAGQKVALVLSGGGAKGLAHIGVIKALEENNIPIDYVVGTSMGGIVGGMYAAGYSPFAVEEIVTQSYFQQWLKGVLSKKYAYFYSKREAKPSFLTLDLSVDSTFTTTLNTNLASDLAINFVFAEMLAQASEKANYNFDSLMVPYRAVAAEVFTQKVEILRSGFLNKAVRATMTVPLFYRPIRINKKYLFDGGIYNNFPVNVAEEDFNPDFIIAVNVATTKFQDYPYENDDKILSESLAFILLEKSDPQVVGENGIYIEPDLANNTSLDFQNASAIIDSGYVMANRKIAQIKDKITRRVNQQQMLEKRNKFKEGFKPFYFGDVRLIGFNAPQRKYVRKLFETKHKQLDLDDVKSGYYKLVSENYFKNIFPNIVYNETTGLFDLEIFARQARNFKVDFGGNISSRSISEIYLGFQYNYLNRFLNSYSVNFYTGRFYQSIQARPRFNVPSRKLFYIEPEFTINTWNFIDAQDLVLGGNPTTVLDQTDRKYGVNLGIAAGTKGKLLLQGAFFNNSDRFSNKQELVTSDTLDVLNFKGFRYGIAYRRNTLNRKQYPDAGSAISVSLDYFNGTENYEPGSTSLVPAILDKGREWFRFKVSAERYFKASWFHYGFYFESVLSNQPFFANYTATLVNSPAFYPLQDSKTLFLTNFRSFNYGAGGIRNVFNLSRSLDLRIEGYAYKPFREIVETATQEASFREDLKKFYFVGSVAGVYNSPLGPVSLSLNYYDDSQKRLGALLHIGYLLYNKRSTE
ncbi:patatin-like phospholipase family protein [Fulvivirgaceae bacterium BMA12]|uniref:Patatin-like phospholipase family protein n=1 Tax=Agaribacillus aureus TaxID=3051825 RepID=A0ABT8LG34_9BACT|nr:patatin-like phospholipase family protein [Fulvivirgaceae bacterium BMA12]